MYGVHSKLCRLTMNNFEKVYAVVRKIPKGKVATYGQIAKLVGIKNPRLVGNILHQNTDSTNVPCHRVVNAKGKLAIGYAFGGEAGQQRRLQKEGINVTNNTIDLTKYLWVPA